MKTSLRGRIDSNIDSLNNLNQQFPFIPNAHQIRPNEESLQSKK